MLFTEVEAVHEAGEATILRLHHANGSRKRLNG